MPVTKQQIKTNPTRITSMNSPEAIPTKETSVKRMAIILILAFLGSQLNFIGEFFALLGNGTIILSISGSWFSSLSYGPVAIKLAAIVYSLMWMSFLTISLYPEHGWRQVVAGFLGVIAWAIGRAGNSNNFLIQLFHLGPVFFPPFIGILVAIPVCLLVSCRIKRLPDLATLGLGLLIGAGLYILKIYFGWDNGLAPIWLSAMFFLELLSRRASWKVALIGGLFSITLMALDGRIFLFIMSR
jgi:hypothetical protein